MESGEDDSHSYNDDSHSYIDDTSSVTDELQSLEDLDLGGLVSVMSLRFLAPDVERLYLRHIGADRGFSLVWAVLVFLLLSLAACMVFAAGLWSSEGANAPRRRRAPAALLPLLPRRGMCMGASCASCASSATARRRDIGGGANIGGRSPQSVQSDPRSHHANSEPGPPSSQSPSEA